MSTSHVFVSHSQKDKSVVATVRRAFVGMRKLRPFLFEKKLVAQPPSKEIVEKIRESRALFAFLTRNSLAGETRDWMIFELGIAHSSAIPIYAWKARNVRMSRTPRLVEQLTTYHQFKVSSKRDRLRLRRDVERAVKEVFSSLEKRSGLGI